MRPRLSFLAGGTLLLLAAPVSAHESGDHEHLIQPSVQAPVRTESGALGPGHIGRPTSAARRTLAAPDGFADAAARWTAAEPFRSRSLAASGGRAYRVTLWRDGRHDHRLVVVRGDREYVLPAALNQFLAEATVDATGDAADEVARLVAESHRPEEEASFEASQVIDLVSADGERFVRRMELVTAGGIRREWEFAYGAGDYVGQVRLAREFEWRDGRRVQIGAASVTPFTIQTHGVTGGGDITFEDGQAFLLTRVNNTATGHQAVFSLAGFLNHTTGLPETDVYARVVSIIPAYGPLFLDATAIPIDGLGNGTLNWTPALNSLTGIVNLQLGNANPANPAGTFVPNAGYPNPRFVVERSRQIKYPGATVDSVRIHYCGQFFQNHALGTGHAETFIGYVEAGLTESWQRQVIDWSLAQGHPDDEPLDADDLHHLFVNDHVNDFRGTVTGGSGSKASVSNTARRVWIRNDGWYNDVAGNAYAVRLYTNEDVRTRIAIAHEFLHGVQAGWITGHLANATAFWVIEGQARALPTVQYSPEEFLDAHQHLYPQDANGLLRNGLNQSLDARSYREGLYWRFLCDRNHPAGGDALQMRLFRETLQELPGRAIVAGSYESATTNALRAALAADGGAFPTFEASRDSFAHAMWRHDWPHPTPTSLLYPAVTADPDSDRTSATWPGGFASHDDQVPVHFGVDFWKFVVAAAPPDLRRMHLCFDPDPDRDTDHGRYHLTVLNYRGAGLHSRVHLAPAPEAGWDSTFDVRNGDSLAVVVHRVDTLAVEGTYRITLSEPLAVDGAYWDHIQTVLAGMGPRYRHVEIGQGDLDDPAFPWCRYDAIFLNCSPTYSVSPTARDSLRAFVNRGGYLYASDYDYLFVHEAFPGRIQFGGKVGNGQTVQATVTDPGLAAVLASGTASVSYNLGAWVTVDAPGAGTTVHMRGTYEVSGPGSPQQAADESRHAHPHASQAEDDRATGTTAAEAAWPRPDAPGAASPTPSPSLQATKSGPLLLSFAHGKGRVIFTTFHNSAQVGAQQQQVLRYLIFRQVAGDLLANALDSMTSGWTAWQQIVDGIGPGEGRDYRFQNPFNGPIRLILNWGGSNLRLTARRPDGSVEAVAEGPSHPLVLDIPSAAAGEWTWEVEALDVPDENYAFALVVSGPTAIPGSPVVESAPDAFVCEGTTSIVKVPIRNAAFFADSFHVEVASALGWSVQPSDTTITAYEGMADSLAVRLVVPAGAAIGTLDSVRVTLTSALAPANTASGARAARLQAVAPDLVYGASTYEVCPGISTDFSGTLAISAGCAGNIVIERTGSQPWPITPAFETVPVNPGDQLWTSFSVSVPAGAAHGAIDQVTLVAYSEDDPTQRDSLVLEVQVRFEAPLAAPAAPVSGLRTQQVTLMFEVENRAACAFPASLELTDSLGWSIPPPYGAGYLFPGGNIIYIPVWIPADAPIGGSNPVTLTLTPVGPPLAPAAATGRVMVDVPGEVLLVDPSGGYYGSFLAGALTASGRTWTAWTSYSPITAAGLEQFDKVVWAPGSWYLSEPDTSALGAYLRGGGRALVTGQDMLLDPTFSTPFLAAYAGAGVAGQGSGTFVVTGHPGSFMSGFEPADLFGPEGAWNQYSPDELDPLGSAFPILDYVPGPAPAEIRREPPHLAWPPADDGGPGTRIARALGGRVGGGVQAAHPPSASRPTPPRTSLTTGVAAVANDAGTWRMILCGFGLEGMAPAARRDQAIAAMLAFLDGGVTSAPGPHPSRVELAASPNPSRGAVRFALGLPASTRVRLSVHDAQGRLIAVAHEGTLAAGRHSVAWEGGDASRRAVGAGIYFVRLESGEGTLVRKIVRL